MARIVKITLLLACLLGIRTQVLAQDPQFSQFYANQVLLSPAFTGSTEGPRLALNARSQWSAIPGAYRTFAAAFDLPVYFGETRHGLGLSFMADQAGAGNLTKLDIVGNYAYRILLNDYNAIRLGLGFGIQQTTIDFYRLRFPNQYDPVSGFDPSRTSGEIADESRITPEITAGAMYYNKLMWIGLNVNHITEPEQKLTGGPGSAEKLPMKFSLFSGFNIPIEQGIFKSVSPVIMYRQQGPFNQLDLGCYVNFDPIVFGLYYRALEPDAVIGLVGIQKGQFRIGYSYDYTVSSLTNTVSGGSHEISFVVEFDRLPRRPKRASVNMSCPKF